MLPDWLIGNINDVAEREYANYNFDDQTRTRDLGDTVGDWFSGGRRSKIDDAVKALHIKKLTELHGGDREEFLNYMPNAKIDSITAKTNPVILQQQINRTRPKVQDVKKALGLAAINNVPIDPQKFGGDANQIRQYVAKETKNTAEDERKKLNQEALTERMRQEGILNKQSNFQNTMALRQMGLSDQRLANQMEVNQMQNALQMRREDRADRRGERDKMMAMIAMLTQGLGNVGNIIG